MRNVSSEPGRAAGVAGAGQRGAGSGAAHRTPRPTVCTIAAPIQAAPPPRPLDTIRGRVSNVVAGAGERERVELGQPAINAAKTRQLTAGSLIVINRQVARALLGQEPVGLPGLTPRSFRRTPDGTVVVEQALDSSTLIQIFQRPASSAALSDSVSGYTRAFAFARTDRLLARYVGTLRVEIAGPVSPDSLNKLLDQVAPLP